MLTGNYRDAQNDIENAQRALQQAKREALQARKDQLAAQEEALQAREDLMHAEEGRLPLQQKGHAPIENISNDTPQFMQDTTNDAISTDKELAEAAADEKEPALTAEAGEGFKSEQVADSTHAVGLARQEMAEMTVKLGHTKDSQKAV